MGKVDLYFFHGFLGEPLDWTSVVESLPMREELNIHTPDLVELFNSVDPHPSLAEAATLFSKNSMHTSQQKVFVGYSMGGRFLMHLPLEAEDKVVLLGAHPGLREGLEKRESSDKEWVDRSKQCSQQEWLLQWNKQDVFKRDATRPQRDIASQRFQTYMQILTSWSLAKQSDRRQWLEAHKENISWVFGEKDLKFQPIADELSIQLPAQQFRKVPDAGHGVIFENPRWVAELIKEVINGF